MSRVGPRSRQTWTSAARWDLGFVGPLDALPATLAAYSLRRLRSAYAGKACNIRRSSDNTTQDIGFAGNGDFDATTFSSFIGAGNGFVTKWYDQSGNASDASQATAAQQPQITLNAVNGHPVVTFTGASNTVLNTAASVVSSGIWTVNVISHGNGSEGFVLGSNSSQEGVCFDQGAANNFNFLQGGFSTAGTASDASFHSATAVANNASSKVIVDGTTTTGNTTTSQTLTGTLSIGSLNSAGNSFQFTGPIAELIVWDGDKSSSIPTLRTNDQTYYGTA